MEEFRQQNRRDFLRYMFGATTILGGGFNLLGQETLSKKGITKLTILYTNDVHSRIEPFPDNDPKYPNQAGFARRAALIKKIRSEEKNILLLDAGDIFQGTPYFNFYAGELEYKLMSAMVKQMPHANFNFVCANYNFKDTVLDGRILPYKIFIKDGIKIGVFGLGIELEGLVDKKNYGETKYNDPVEEAKKTATLLKKGKNCDYVICLSHLGYAYQNKKVSDQVLSAETSDIDLIIGGHTHTFLEEPVLKNNSKNKPIYVTHVGWAGIWLGRMDVYFSKNAGIQSSVASTVKINDSIA